MRKIILFMHMSLDGFIARSDGALDWVTMDDKELGEVLIGDMLENSDTMLLGRSLYQGFESYWPNAAKDPATPPDLAEFAKWIDETQKVVFSKTLESVTWNQSVLEKGDLSESVAKLKSQPGKNIVLFGGAKMSSALAGLGLIDEFRIKLEPVVLGSGVPLFKDVEARVNLKLTFAQSFSSGVVGLIYQKG